MDNSLRNKNLLQGTGIYAIGMFGTKLLSFIIVPLYTYYIATNDMGVYDLLVSTVSLLAPLVTMQISDAAYRWIIHGEGDTAAYIRAALQVLFANCLLATLLILGVNRFIKIPYCAYFVLLLISTRIMETLQKLLRALRRQKLFAFSGILYSAVFLLLNVYRICVKREGITCLFQNSIFAGWVTIVYILVSVPDLRVNILQKPDLPIVRDFYRYSIPLVPNYLNWWIINSSDRYIVAFFLGVSSNGILAITHKFPTLLQTVLTLFTSSWQDLAVSENERNTGAYYTKVFRIYARLVLSMMWLLIPLTKIFINLVMGADYKIACDYVAFYYLGAAFQSFSSFYGVGYLRRKNTKQAFSTSICGAVINAITNLAMVRWIGLQASAISTFLGFLVMWIIREKQNRDELGIVVRKAEIITCTLIGIAVSVLSIIGGYALNILLAVGGTVGAFLLNRAEIKTVLQFVTKKLDSHGRR